MGENEDVSVFGDISFAEFLKKPLVIDRENAITVSIFGAGVVILNRELMAQFRRRVLEKRVCVVSKERLLLIYLDSLILMAFYAPTQQSKFRGDSCLFVVVHWFCDFNDNLL